MNLSHLIEHLGRPWWTPRPPHDYVLVRPDGQTAGVGLIVGDDIGSFNLGIAVYGSIELPTTLLQQQNLVSSFVWAKTQIGDIQVEGHPVSSYAMLMRPKPFEVWFRALPVTTFQVDARHRLRRALRQWPAALV